MREFLRTRETGGTDMLPLRARVTRQGAMSFELNSLFGEIPIGDDGTGAIEDEIPRSEIEYFADRFLTLGTDMIVGSPTELIAAIREKAMEVVKLYS